MGKTNKNEEVKLERSLSSSNVWALAFGCIIGWGAFVMPGNTFLGKAGPGGTAIGMLVAALIMIVIALNYSFMINRYPVAGGEFVYANHCFGRKHAFVCSWFLGLSYLAIVPLNATALALIGRNLMGGIFQVGFHYTVAGYSIYLGEIVLAIAALIIFALLSIRGVKFAGVFQTGLTVALIGGVVIVAVAALLSDKASIANLEPAFYPTNNKFAAILSIVAVAPWAFVGFDTVPQAAEEFDFPAKKSRMIMIVAILFGGLIYVILNTVTAMVVPDGYASWVEYIDDLSNLKGMISLPTFNAAHELLGTGGVIFLGLSVCAAILSGVVGFYMATSRLFYSMSKENVLPKWFGKLDPKYNTPKNAILFTLAVAVIAPFFGRTALNWIVDMSSTGAAIGYGYTSLAAMKLAWKDRNMKVTVTGAIGTVFAVIFLVLLLVPIEMFGCSLGKESYICLIVWIVLGVIFYVVSNRKNKNGRGLK